MTKQREIALLDEMIGRFGPDSYIGPWLKENRAQIAADILNDFGVCALMPGEARAQARDIIEAAQVEAGCIKATAEKFAADTREAAYVEASSIRNRARTAVERLLVQL